jgi:hypothetical protein
VGWDFADPLGSYKSQYYGHTLTYCTCCGGGLEDLHSPASRRKRLKENPVLGAITGPLCHCGTQVQGPGPPSWGLDARLTTLLCKKIILQNLKKSIPEEI